MECLTDGFLKHGVLNRRLDRRCGAAITSRDEILKAVSKVVADMPTMLTT